MHKHYITRCGILSLAINKLGALDYAVSNLLSPATDTRILKSCPIDLLMLK